MKSNFLLPSTFKSPLNSQYGTATVFRSSGDFSAFVATKKRSKYGQKKSGNTIGTMPLSKELEFQQCFSRLLFTEFNETTKSTGVPDI
ncbi:hypothetical protein EAE99_008700 [Botrytis elliptica]|nr:hypothetical protein EAE99_008700 [Botrytis elliptica]